MDLGPKHPPSLESMQRWMKEFIADPSNASAPAADLLSWIESSGKLDAESRLNIYAESYFERILDSLAGDFPATKQVLGEERFRRQAAQYILRSPSRFPNLEELGRDFPKFFSAETSEPGLEFLPDLVKLEWLSRESFYTDWDIERSTPSEPQVELLAVSINPSLRQMSSSWPLLRWLDPGATPLPSDGSLAIAVFHNRQGRRFLILSPEDEILLAETEDAPSLALLADRLARRDFRTDELPKRISQWIAEQVLFLSSR